MALFSYLLYNDAFDYTAACLCGIALSVYALWVEVQKHRNPLYVAACDLSDHMNCSRVLTSEYSKGFGLVKYLLGEEHVLNVPNCVTGILFYSFQLLLVQVKTSWALHLLFDTCVVACIGSIYLAYILAFVLHDVCLVCISTYVVNFYLLYQSYYRFSQA